MPHLLPFATILACAVLAAPQVRADDRMAEAGAAGDAIVAPVKRVAPRTPVFTHGAAGGTGASGGKKNKPIVPARPNCDPGFKVDDSGTRCVKVAGGEPSKSGKKKKNR